MSYVEQIAEALVTPQRWILLTWLHHHGNCLQSGPGYIPGLGLKSTINSRFCAAEMCVLSSSYTVKSRVYSMCNNSINEGALALPARLLLTQTMVRQGNTSILPLDNINTWHSLSSTHWRNDGSSAAVDHCGCSYVSDDLPSPFILQLLQNAAHESLFFHFELWFQVFGMDQS